MAARLNKLHQEDVRLKIKTSQLINRLQNYALGDDAIVLESGHLKAIEILLRKSLPDLSAVTVSGDPEAPIKHEHGLAPAAQLVLERIQAIAERSGKTGETDA